MSFDVKILDTNYQYNNLAMDKFHNLIDKESYTAWLNDILLIQVLLYSEIDDKYSIEVSNDKINFNIYSVRKNLAYSKKAIAPIPIEDYTNKELVSDILINSNEQFIESNNTHTFIIECKIPKNINSISQNILINIKNKNSIIKKNIKLNIIDKTVELNNSHDIELWQYPYSVAEYYGVEPFDERHLDILKKHLIPYKELGGDTITGTFTEDAWGGQTYGKNKIKFPSMIKWTMKDGEMSYDYSHLDKWINFARSNGFMKKKLVLYGMAPWHNSFTYYKDDELVMQKFDVNSEEYRLIWKDFLLDLYNHLDKLGILGITYLGIDEMGFCPEIFNLVEEVNNEYGKDIKISGAINDYKSDNKYIDKLDSISVALIEYEKDIESFRDTYELRRKNGKFTSLYSCTGHKPGNFTISEPMETYFTVIKSYVSDGFLRWAYDAWTKNPLIDSSFVSFEPGDCYLVYPNDNENYPNLSYRYLKIKEALYDIYKLKQLNLNKNIIETVFKELNTKIKYSLEYLDTTQKKVLEKDIANIKNIIN